jgi:hypothetical protein
MLWLRELSSRVCVCQLTGFVAGDLETKQAEAERLRKERTEMEKKLKLYESKILQSEHQDGKSMAEKASEREALLKRKQDELQKR